MLADLSIVYPIARSAPLFVTLFAVLFFDETLTWWGFMGIVSVLIGVYLLTLNFPDDKKSISAVSSFKNKGLLFAFFTALTVTAYSLIDKQGAQHLHPILYVWTMNGVALIPLTLLIVFTKQEQVSIEWKENKWPILVSSFLNLLSYSLIIFVMQTYQVSYIVSIRQISVVFGVIFGGTVLKERNIKSRLLFSILIFAGLFLISLS
jgi:uncharacterized membrane protein